MARYKYPLIECSKHPGPQHSYAVCKHVAAGTAPVHHMHYATQTEMGECLCAVCSETRPPVEGLTLWCGAHLVEWLDRREPN